MRDLDSILKENIQMAQAMDFLFHLPPDEVGEERIGTDFLLKFEGFTEMCWDDAKEKGKTIQSLEAEIINDWANRLAAEGLKARMIEHGWTYEPEFYAETTFWAMYHLS